MWRRVQSRNGVIGAGWIVKAVLVCLFVGCSCAGYLWQKSQVHQLGQSIRGLENDLDRLEKGNDVLLQRYSVLVSNPVLEQQVEQYGLDLRSPVPEQILRLREVGNRDEVSLARPYGYSPDRLSRRN